MKMFQKLFFATALVAMTSGALMSCSSDDDAAPITITPNAIAEQAEGTTSYTVTGKVSAEAGLALIKYYRVAADGTETAINPSIEFPTAATEYNINLVVPNLVTGDNKIKIEVTDKSPRKVSSIVNIKVKGDPLALVPAVQFTLGRPGTTTNPATANGIEYKDNPSATEARFDGKFVMLTEAAFTAITTKAALKKAYDDAAAAEKVTTFNLVSDANFAKKYLIALDGTTYRLVEAMDLKFVAGANVATFKERH